MASNRLSTTLGKQFLHSVRLIFSLLLPVFGYFPGTYAQPAQVKWFPAVKTAKDQHTLALLSAGPNGFHLLRWQDRRTDAQGNTTPAMPLLTVLSASGERVQDEPLPGFADGGAWFRFVLPADSVLLVFYEAPDVNGGQGLFCRRYNLDRRQWSAAPELIFSELSKRAPAFATAWYSRSADGQQWCVYQLSGNTRSQLSVAVFDREFRLRWRRQVNLPAQAGPLAVRRVLCTNAGAVAVHASIFGAGSSAQVFEEPPTAYRPDGRPLFRAFELVSELPAHSNAIFWIESGKDEIAAFYPNTGKKFAPSVELNEGADGTVYASGLTAESSNGQVNGYFIYAVDPKALKGDFLQNAPLPVSVRKAFLSEKAAAKKEPVEGLALRWLGWAQDGKPWLLVERESFESTPGRIDAAALLRLDTAYRITAARKIEKFQQIPAGEPQCFASVAACPGPKGAWWMLWNQGHWPETKLILTECRPNGEPTDHMLDAASRSNVTMLPHTLLNRDGRWYFVGESEYHERIRVGMLE